ncbi:MAG: hypothetical protein QXV75_07680 [Candidatus Bathyarchaeia archaeon]
MRKLPAEKVALIDKLLSDLEPKLDDVVALLNKVEDRDIKVSLVTAVIAYLAARSSLDNIDVVGVLRVVSSLIEYEFAVGYAEAMREGGMAYL